MLNLSLLSYSLGWLVGRQPALFHQSLNYLLLTQVKTQQRNSDLFDFGGVFAAIDDPAGPFEGKIPFQVHDDPKSADIYVERAANLLFLTVDKPIPHALAVVRFTLFSSEGHIKEVAEYNYPDNAEGMISLQEEVVSALSVGMDVCILSALDAEDFPMMESMVNAV